MMMNRKRSWILALILACLSAWVAAQAPPRTRGGQTLQIPEKELDLGLVYHSEPGLDAQLVVTSDAPLQKVVVTHGRVVGYIVAPFDLEDAEVPILAGAFRVPARLFTSGLESVDGRVHGGQLLDAESNPEIEFRILEVSNIELEQARPELRSYALDLAGELRVKSATLPLKLNAQIRFIPFTMQNLARNVGDLAILETSFSLKPADHGWSPPRQLQGVLAEEIQVDVHLILNTVSPDKSGDPREDPVLFTEQLRFVTLLRDLGDAAGAYSHARSFMPKIWDQSDQLQRLARAILDTPGAPRRDYHLALEAATRASELGGAKDPAALALIATIHYESGDYSQAVAWQQKAVENLAEKTPARQAQAIRSTLEKYQREAKDPVGSQLEN